MNLLSGPAKKFDLICCCSTCVEQANNFTKNSSATMLFVNKFLQVFDKQKGAGAGAAILNFGSGSGRLFNFGSSSSIPHDCQKS